MTVNVFTELYYGDNLQKAQDLAKTYRHQVQLILTSTPYPGQRGFQVSVQDYLAEWLPDRLAAWLPLLDPVTGVYIQNIKLGRQVVDGGSRFDLRVFEIPRILASLRFQMFPIDVAIWDKINAPPAGNHERHDRDGYEFLFVFGTSPNYTRRPWREPYNPKTVKKNATGNPRQASIFGNLASGHAELHPEGAAADNVIRVSSSGDQNRPRVEGGSFPRKLAERMIKQYSDPGDLVLDPCGGAGTTVSEAALAGRHGIYIDNKPEAWNTAADWLKRIYGILAAPDGHVYQPPSGPDRIRFQTDQEETRQRWLTYWDRVRS